jgi:NAD-dependent DNA ligase
MNKFLEFVCQKYYDGESILTDSEYDYLETLSGFDQLGSPPLEGVPHFNRLYSQQKYYESDTLPPNLNQYYQTPKLDGSCVSLTYADGELVQALTRGDGFMGENISHNIIGWKKVPQELSENTAIIQIVGEIIAPSSVENSRNYASGATRLNDQKEFLERDVDFIAYGIYYKDVPFVKSTYKEDLDWLSRNGFRVVNEKGLQDIYPTDGIVYRLNESVQYWEAGFTAKHPKGSFALKNTADFETKETVLRSVIWQVGKSGKVTPVAIFDPIVLEDATVAKATLHNAGFIEALNLYLNDTIIVTRAGGIIPKVLGVV